MQVQNVTATQTSQPPSHPLHPPTFITYNSTTVITTYLKNFKKVYYYNVGNGVLTAPWVMTALAYRLLF